MLLWPFTFSSYICFVVSVSLVLKTDLYLRKWNINELNFANLVDLEKFMNAKRINFLSQKTILECLNMKFLTLSLLEYSALRKKFLKQFFDPRIKKIYQSETNFQKSKKSSPNKIYIHTKNWRFIIILDYINT